MRTSLRQRENSLYSPGGGFLRVTHTSLRFSIDITFAVSRIHRFILFLFTAFGIIRLAILKRIRPPCG